MLFMVKMFIENTSILEIEDFINADGVTFKINVSLDMPRWLVGWFKAMTA